MGDSGNSPCVETPCQTRRIITRVIVLLLLGAIVNVAVAWGISLRPEVPWAVIAGWPRSDLRWPIRQPDQVLTNPVYLATETINSFMRSEYSLPQNTSEHIEDVRKMYQGVLSHHGRKDPMRSGTEALLLALDYMQVGEPGFFVLHETSTGWPLLSLSGYEWQTTIGRNSTSEFCFALMMKSRPVTYSGNSTGCWGGPTTYTVTQNRLLPFLPAWPGFAINTIFYAVILWLLWVARRTPGKIRRFVRVRRGRCPACGFIIAPGTCANGLCSECGGALPGRLES